MIGMLRWDSGSEGERASTPGAGINSGGAAEVGETDIVNFDKVPI